LLKTICLGVEIAAHCDC